MAANRQTKMKSARPAARKSTGKNKPAGTAREASAARKPFQPTESEPANPRRRFVELPKVPGELPTPTATFYF